MNSKSTTTSHIPESEYKDLRTKEEIERQRKIIKSLCKENEAAFSPLVEIAKKNQHLHDTQRQNTITRMDFPDGRYVFYSDSIVCLDKNNQQTHTLPIIMTIHGIPGTAKDFNQLQFHTQAQLSCRWITYLTPGLDRTDERRGTYRGYLEETAHLMNDFLTRLNIQQPVILIMHSGGGMYGKNFALLYPNRVRAFVQLACIGINRWKFFSIETQIMANAGADAATIIREEIDSEEFRAKFSVNIFKTVDEMAVTMEARQKEIMMLKGFHISDHLMLLKVQVGGFKGGFNEFFSNCRSKLKLIPRFFAYSAVDKLLEEENVQHEIHHVMLAEHANMFSVPNEISNDPNSVFFSLKHRKNGISAYVFEYNDAGHAVQHVKAFDISVKLAHFINSLPLFEKSQSQIHNVRSML